MDIRLHTILLTTLALIAFAANSILCRMALGSTAIDPASFSTIRLVSGAVMLWAIMKITAGAGATRHSGSWISAAMLFLYAVAFSFAYVSLDAGMGALILFGSVQATMISFGLSKGERPPLADVVWFAARPGRPGVSGPARTGSTFIFCSCWSRS